MCLLEAIKGLNPNWLSLLLKPSKQSTKNVAELLVVVVKTWSRKHRGNPNFCDKSAGTNKSEKKIYLVL